MKDSEIAQTINTIRDIAVEFGGSQQLRERIAEVLVPLLKAGPGPLVVDEDTAMLGGSWIAAEDLHRKVKALDVALNGSRGAQQPMLIDVLGQLEAIRRQLGQPVLWALREALEPGSLEGLA